MSRAEYRSIDGKLVEVRTETTTLTSSDYPGMDFAVTVDGRGDVVGFAVKCRRSPLEVGGQIVGDLIEGETITARYLRSIRFAELADAAHGSLWEDVKRLERERDNSDLTHARIARRYVEAMASGSKRPLADVADHVGMSYSATRNKVREARRRELLSATAKGKAGGHLTAKATTILDNEGRADQ